ncbi:hypothetical protein [Vibrio vulnificus]|uniref:hypothetical protein n=1 Tax=Vibrio vulnificus TaxID=672 RepID=UPI00102BC34B|nr:hypothetical protein [Vibrio vulnificus]RZQ75857.1 hypothetical protein D8T22_14460 [Vibrio vulnificus]
MEDIRNRFIEKIFASAREAIGVSCITYMGKAEHQRSAMRYPDARFFVGAGDPNDPKARRVNIAPTHREIQNTLASTPNLVLELYLTVIIQHWFDFLSEIYEEAMRRNYFGGGDYPVPKLKVQLDPTLKDNELYEHLIKVSVDDFDFIKAQDKFNIVRKILNVQVEFNSPECQLLKVNIQVRNALQHRLGILTEKDFSDLGSKSIEEDHGDRVVQKSVGQRVTRTEYDIEALVNALNSLSRTLIPNT